MSAAEPVGRERADSRRKRLRLIEAAREAVAELGLGVAAADIAERAEVGVGTLYRRFGSKEALIEAVLYDAIGAMVAAAEEAVRDEDPWAALEAYLTALVRGQLANRGLSEFTRSSDVDGSPEFLGLTLTLRRVLEELTGRAQRAGVVRNDVSWRDVALLAQAASGTAGCLGVEADARQWRRTLAVLLEGLRPPGHGPLPGRSPVDGPLFRGI